MLRQVATMKQNENKSKMLNIQVKEKNSGVIMTKVLIIENVWDKSDESMKMLRNISKVKILLERWMGMGVSLPPSEDEIIKEIEDADVIIVRWGSISERVLKKAKNLKLIIVQGSTKYDNVDVITATKIGSYVSFLPFSAAAPPGSGVPEFAITLILALFKKLLVADRCLRMGDFWARERSTLLPHRLQGKTLGIIGIGKMGSQVSKIANAFGLNVIAYDPYVTEDTAREAGAQLVNLQALMSKSDIVTIHCTLEGNYHLIGKKELNLMKKSAVLVNTARGPIVDQASLYNALRNGRIAGAALDVFEKEPPDINNPLFNLGNVIVTPHMAGLTYETRTGLGIEIVEEIKRVMKGEVPKYLVNSEVLEAKTRVTK